MQEFTTIRVSKEIRDELSLYGSKQESFESILSKIIREKKSHSSPEHKIPTNDLEVITWLSVLQIKLTLGRGISSMAHYANIPPKKKVRIKIDYRKLYAEQRAVLVDIIENEVTIGKALLKLKSGFGDGTFNRRSEELLQLRPQFVYNRKNKIYTDTKAEIDKPLIESEVEKSVWVFQM